MFKGDPRLWLLKSRHLSGTARNTVSLTGMRQHREETVPKARRDWNTEGKVLGKNQVPPSQETAGFHKVGVGGLQAGREVLGPDEWGSWEIGKVVSSEEEVKSFAVE